jgi:hypothetical protein
MAAPKKSNETPFGAFDLGIRFQLELPSARENLGKSSLPMTAPRFTISPSSFFHRPCLAKAK